jgi:hypothetical protein
MASSRKRHSSRRSAGDQIPPRPDCCWSASGNRGRGASVIVVGCVTPWETERKSRTLFAKWQRLENARSPSSAAARRLDHGSSSTQLRREAGRAWRTCSAGVLRASVRYTDARHSHGAQETDREHPQAGSCQTAEDDGGKPGVRFLARSKRGTRFRTASLLGGTRQRGRRFCSPWVGRDQGRRDCQWRSRDDRNWLSFHESVSRNSNLTSRLPNGDVRTAFRVVF